MPGGRPTLYTTEIADEICERMAIGETLRAICREDKFPAAPTVIGWVMDDRDGFSERYARAREAQAHALADQLLEIADTPEHGVTITTEADGTQKVVEGDMIAHRRLRYDARKWLTSKILPKVFGDKSTVDLHGTLTLEQLVTQSLEKK